MLRNDLLIALRTLVRRPVIAAAVVTTLTLGFGGVNSIFLAFYATLIEPLPYPRENELVELTSTYQKRGLTHASVSLPDFDDWRLRSRSFSHMAAVSVETLVMTGLDHPERIACARVSSTFFALLGVKPELGHIPQYKFSDNDVVVLEHRFFRDRLGGDSEVLGKALTLDHKSYRIVAVMPESVALPREAHLWLPLNDDGEYVRGARYLKVIARLKNSVTPQQAAAELKLIAESLESEYPETNTGYGAAVTQLRERLVGNLKRPLLILLVGVGILMLLVCGNVTSLLLARNTERLSEANVRIALGATRLALTRQLLTESMLLAVIGGSGGMALGVVGARILITLYAKEIPYLEHIPVAPAVIAFNLVFTVAVGLALGLLLSIHFVRHADTCQITRGTSRQTSSRDVITTQSAILILQIAVSLILIITASLVLQSLFHILHVEPGFRTAGVLTARIVLPTVRYGDESSRRAFFSALLDRLKTRPRFESVGAVTNLPLSGTNMRFGVRLAASDIESVSVNYRAVSPGYFRTLGVPVVEGRSFTDWDRPGAPPVAIVNLTFARRYLAEEKAVGRQVFLSYQNDGPRRIVGVLGDIRHSGYSAEVQPEIFVPYSQHPWPFMTFVLRSDGDPLELVPILRNEVAALDADQPVDQVVALEDLLSDSVTRPVFYGVLLSGFALIALAVALFGSYGLNAYWVRLRIPEAGIRMAMGATPSQIVALLLRRPLYLAGAGVLLGELGAWLSTCFLQSWLYGVSSTDSTTFTLSALLLPLAVILASLLAARRASQTNLSLALREE